MPIALATNFFSSYPDSWIKNFNFLGIKFNLIYPLVGKLLPPFADLRVITAGAECIRLGYDVLVSNPCDPWKRPMNYPRIWSVPASWGLDQSHTVILGILFGLLFFSLVFITIKRLNYIEALFYALILCSPSAMLAIERGNNDLIIFILLSLSLLIMKNKTAIWRYFSYIIIMFAAILKLYPIFALITALKEKKRIFTVIFLSIFIVFGIYVVTNYESIILVSKATPRGTILSYGGKVIFDVIFDELDRYFYSFNNYHIPQYFNKIKLLLFSLTIALFLLISYLLAKHTQNLFQNNKLNLNQIEAFRVGSSIYIGTFLIGNNWDYRLIFLLFTIPQILAWLKTQVQFESISGLALMVIILTTWLSSKSDQVYYLDELLNWLLFLFLVYSTILTLPNWLKNYIYFQPRGFDANNQ
ncbi:glycosyltransferase 87 family protein [Microcoleus sp. AR_TQ3_B6]|uniref:glycosyltransferase 87 family protein n=1 Tax=Microcoleus sp. AR_TQ3_B6 TaxID=3055284 RepID=UPI002FCF21D8